MHEFTNTVNNKSLIYIFPSNYEFYFETHNQM
jgi:hypothetical protein